MNDRPAIRVGGDAGLAAARPAPQPRRRKPEDTPAGCRAFAAADLGRAATQNVDRGRWLFESSAAAWSARADLLERLARQSDARMRSASQ
ncbi:hypothetical protein [Sphingosinicella sp. CPCC 101087]|uniref:hypothetical protein n=1 Tax=Sphingosinicella sp. CPCC 101087 TaxID=2497754 RepID=UPI00101B5EA0|nr:hypothetical protein [Sphingosinicella sp. CPCC 101087]